MGNRHLILARLGKDLMQGIATGKFVFPYE